MNSLVKSKSVQETIPPAMVLKMKKPVNLLNNNYNNILNRMDIALSEMDLKDDDFFYFKNFKTYQYNDNIIIVSNTEASEII